MMRKVQPILLIIIFICLVAVSFGSLFGVEKITGMVSTSLTIIEVFYEDCNITLYEGWNLVGLSCELINKTPYSLINSTNNSIISIHKYNSDDVDDPWKVYRNDLPEWVVLDLPRVDRYNGYWVNVKNNITVQLNGTLKTPTNIILDPGWQLVGYPNLHRRNVSYSLSSMKGGYSRVYSYNESRKDWQVYNPALNWEDQSLQYLTAFQGLWINVTERGAWYVD